MVVPIRRLVIGFATTLDIVQFLDIYLESSSHKLVACEATKFWDILVQFPFPDLRLV